MAAADNPYDVLGVSSTAEPRDIKKAYFAKVREFPPETHPEQFQRLREAYETLSNPEARKAYDASRVEAYAELGQELAAVMRAAAEAMADNALDRAAPLLDSVLQQRPEAEEARARLCSCLLSLQKFAEAEAHGRELVTRFPDRSQAHVLLGHALSGLGRGPDARTAFLEAVRLGPLDFRPVRAVVDLDLAAGRHDAALAFVEERRAAVGDTPLTLALRFERISILNQANRAKDAEAALDALLAALTEREEKDDAAFFLEREGAALLARGQPHRAEAFLSRLRTLAPHRDTSALTTQATVRVNELPEASREWLVAQRKEPEILVLPGAGLVADALLMVVALAIYGLMALAALAMQTGWDNWDEGALLFGAGFFGTAGVFAALMAVRFVRHLKSKVGRFVAVHPLYLMYVDLDEVTLWPLVTLTRMDATHQHTNGVYTHTFFNLFFGKKVRTLTVRPQQLGEQVANTLQGIRNRLLELLHGGVLAAERGADFVPAALMLRRKPPRTFRTAKTVLAGVALGGALLAVAAFSGGRAAEDAAWVRANQDPTPGLGRAYLAHYPSGRFSSAAREQLAAKQRKVAERLARGAPQLAAALKAASPEREVRVPVMVQGRVTLPAFAPPGDRRLELVPVPDALLPDTARTTKEQELVAHLQHRFDARFGSGWVTFHRAPPDMVVGSEVPLAVRYELTLSGRVFSVTAGAGPGTAVWLEPVAKLEASLGGTPSTATVAPPKSFLLQPRLARAVTTGSPAEAYGALVDATYAALADHLAALCGVTAPGA